MGGIRSAFGIICILLMIWAQEIQSQAVNTEQESNICVLRKQRGVDIRMPLKPSGNATRENHQLSATLLDQQWTSANSVLNGTAEQLWDIFDKLHRIPFENALDYHWNLIGSYIDHACQKIATQRADSDVRVAVVWIVFCALIVFPVLVNWRLTSLRNPDDVQKMDDIVMLDNDNGIYMVNNTNNANFLQDTFFRRCSARISVHRSELFMAMEIAYNDGDVMLFGLTFSEPFGTARSKNYLEVLFADRANSFRDVTCLSQRKPDFGVARIHTRELNPGLEHASQEQSEGGNGTDLDEDYNIYMVQKFRSPKVSLKDKIIKQLMKKFIADIDKVYGPPIQPAVNLFRKELSGQKKGTDPGKACNLSIIPKRCSPKESQKERDLKQLLKNFIAGIDETYGPPSPPAAKNLYKAFNVSMAPGRFASKMSPNGKDLKQLMKDFIADIDETYGPPTQPVSQNLTKTFQVSMAPRNDASKVSQKDKELKKLMKNFIANIDETYGPPSQSVAKHLYKTFQVSMAPRRCASKMSQKEKELKQLMKNLIANIDETYGPPRQSAVHVFREEWSEQGKGSYLDEVHNGFIAQQDSQQTLQEYLDDIEERKIKTPRRRITDFLWGCQEVMFYIHQVYRKQPIL